MNGTIYLGEPEFDWLESSAILHRLPHRKRPGGPVNIFLFTIIAMSH
jgi:hypothetical protein